MQEADLDRHVQPAVFTELYPEIGAGGFPRNDQQLQFYARVDSLIKPIDSLLDLLSLIHI